MDVPLKEWTDPVALIAPRALGTALMQAVSGRQRAHVLYTGRVQPLAFIGYALVLCALLMVLTE